MVLRKRRRTRRKTGPPKRTRILRRRTRRTRRKSGSKRKRTSRRRRTSRINIPRLRRTDLKQKGGNPLKKADAALKTIFADNALDIKLGARAIASGASGFVWVATATTARGVSGECPKGQRVAVKAVAADFSTEEYVEEEIEALRTLSASGNRHMLHPCSHFEHESDNYTYIVTELLRPGASLFTLFMFGSGGFDEDEARFYMHQILTGVAHIHSEPEDGSKNSWAHRDLKLENVVMYCPPSGEVVAKIIDLGFAQDTSKAITEALVGTPVYMAPELFEVVPDAAGLLKADMFSCGVMLYVMLGGGYPYKREGELGDEMARKISEEEPVEVPPKMITEGPLADSAHPALDLIMQLMDRDPSKRLSAAAALDHPWFEGGKFDPEAAIARTLRKVRYMDAVEVKEAAFIKDVAAETKGTEARQAIIDKETNNLPKGWETRPSQELKVQDKYMLFNPETFEWGEGLVTAVQEDNIVKVRLQGLGLWRTRTPLLYVDPTAPVRYNFIRPEPKKHGYKIDGAADDSEDSEDFVFVSEAALEEARQLNDNLSKAAAAPPPDPKLEEERRLRAEEEKARVAAQKEREQEERQRQEAADEAEKERLLMESVGF